MLVRLAPGASYPPHTHAAAEELHLLDGELWIDERKLLPGDYYYGAPGGGDERVWSKTAAPAFSLPAPMISSAEAPRANDHLWCAVVSRRASGVSPTGLRAATFTASTSSQSKS
jgi:hypothetical protein